MFKVGQKVVCINAKHSNHLAIGEVYKVVDVCYGGTHLIVNRDGYTGEESTYSVNRFDTNTGVTVITPSGTSKVKGGLTAFIDIGDDTHIENHVSPLCKVGVK